MLSDQLVNYRAQLDVYMPEVDEVATATDSWIEHNSMPASMHGGTAVLAYRPVHATLSRLPSLMSQTIISLSSSYCMASLCNPLKGSMLNKIVLHQPAPDLCGALHRQSPII